MPGDYDGDGKTDIAVYRPSSGHWFILKSSMNYAASDTYQWGTTGDTPIGGDFDGDGKTDVAVNRPSTGSWYILTSSSGFAGGLGYAWGAGGDAPVPGDYDGGGKTDVAVYRTSTANWVHFEVEYELHDPDYISMGRHPRHSRGQRSIIETPTYDRHPAA